MEKHQNTQTAPVAAGVPGQKKKRAVRLPLNLFDVVIIALVIALAVLAIGGTQLRALFGFGEEAEACTVEYMILFSDVDQGLALAIAQEDGVFDNATGAAMGQVITTPEVQAHRVVSYIDGKAQMTDKPGTVDVIVTVRADAGYVVGEGYRVGDLVLRVGDNVSLRFPGYAGVGSCINVSRTAD